MLNKKILILSILTMSYLTHFGQCNDITLTSSKDAQVWNYDSVGELDRGTNRRDIVMYEWTKNGSPTTKYALIEFDLSFIPPNSIIDNALISLFHDPESVDGNHSTSAGSNEFYIYRLLGPWEESVSWNQIPQYTEMNKVLVPASNSNTGDYIDINITDLIQDIIKEPNSNFGFLLKLRYTQHYRSVVLASSEHPDPNLHPTLKIVSNQFSYTNAEICNCDEIGLKPNLTNDFVTLNLNIDLLENKEIVIFNSIGQVIHKRTANSNQLEIDVSDYSSGYYYLSIPCKDKKVLKFVVTSH